MIPKKIKIKEKQEFLKSLKDANGIFTVIAIINNDTYISVDPTRMFVITSYSIHYTKLYEIVKRI